MRRFAYMGYGGGAALSCVSGPVGCIASVVIWLVTTVVWELLSGVGRGGGWPMSSQFESLIWVGFAVGAATVYWLVARSIVIGAENTVAKRDRIPPDWVRMIEYDMPRYAHRRPRRRLPR